MQEGGGEGIKEERGVKVRKGRLGEEKEDGKEWGR